MAFAVPSVFSSLASLVLMVGQGELPLKWITLLPGLFIRLCQRLPSLAVKVVVVPSPLPVVVLVEMVGLAP